MVLDLHEGGLERIVTELVRHAEHIGQSAHVLCLNRAGQLADELAGDQVSVLGHQGRFPVLLPRPLAGALRGLRPDVVHLHSGVWLKGAYASWLAGVRSLVFTDHGRPFPDPLTVRLPDMVGARMTDRVVAVSAPLAEYLATRLRVPRTRISVISNGIRTSQPLEPAEVSAIRHELGITAGALVIGTVGRLDPVKAYDRLLTAFAELQRTRPSINDPLELLVVGDGPERERLELLAHALGLGAAVHFLGWRTDVARMLGAMDLFVLPSDSEGTSLALLEAMGSGVAVLATSVGGTPEVLAGGAGLLVPPRDTGSLAAAMGALLSDPARRRQFGLQARTRVERQYSFLTMAHAYHELYRGLVGRA